MDDIYGDLENYNDVNAIDELRNENIELKFKLEDYASRMDKLQKDFDKLSCEFKNLEANYSSLLKTAKAEVERKAQIIANLNMEKDMLVLGSIQNSNKSLLVLRKNMARERSNNRMSRKDDLEPGKASRKDVQEVKKKENIKMRNDENRLPSTDTVSSGNVDDISNDVRTENKLSKLDSYDNNSEIKENFAKSKRALSLKHRRKSLPVLSKQPTKLSSDEEYEDYSEDESKRERLSREDKSRKYVDRQKQSHKISETSGIDEKYSSYHGSSRETYYKSKLHLQAEKLKRGRDKSGYRKHFSPEKVRRTARDYHEDERQDLLRHNRVLVSPPRETYDTVRMFRDRRSNYERDKSQEERNINRNVLCEEKLFHKDDFHEEKRMQRFGFHEERQRRRNDTHSNERYRKRGTSKEDKSRHKTDFSNKRQKERDNLLEARSRHKDESDDERQKQKNEFEERGMQHSRRQERPAKVKASSDFEEPGCKRTRLGTFSKILGSSEDEDANNQKGIREPDEPSTKEHVPVLEFGEHLQSISCQSPDNPHPDVTPSVLPSAQPKEIMNTASTKVEDPRLTSEKYVKSIKEDIVILTTVIGRNVDLVPIDISTWDIPRVEVPEALQRPPEYTDEMVQDLNNMDVENTVSNMSMESESSDRRMADYLSKNFYQDYENERVNHMNAKGDEAVKNVEYDRETKNVTNLHKDVCVDVQSNKEESRRLPPVKYKLHRNAIPEPEQGTTPNPLGVLLKQLQSVCGVTTTTMPPEPKLDVDKTFGVDEDPQNKNSNDVKDKPKEFRQTRRRKMSAREIVEGDLALSDETSDYVCTQKQNKKDKTKEQPPGNTQNLNQKKNTEEETAKSEKTKSDDKDSSLKEDKKAFDEQTTAISIQPDIKTSKKNRKKPGSKPKSASSKEIKTVDAVKIPNKKTKIKKSKSPTDKKVQSKESKFSDIFGDSSSLITPEDLGMITTATKTEKTKKYVPIFEDAQDSVDVSVNMMKKNDMELVQLAATTSKIEEPPATVDQTTQTLVCKLRLPKAKATTGCKENTGTHSLVAQKTTPNMKVSDVVVTQEPVKTVIIATGVQPRIENIHTQNDNVTSTDRNVENTAKVHLPIALATSTPHKKLLLQLEEQVSSCNSSEVQKDDTSSVNSSSISNGLPIEAQSEDVPDVRIFVRRRRRLK